ncbi:MAG TPA: CHRD domain-containing protein [Gemmatimonadaceae bacterium]|nr:CHRD domain-containing protein [Gemmatimonadaceae bacterium]
MTIFRSLRTAAVAVAVAAAAASSAQAQTSFTSFLNGAQEAPTPRVTPAFGNGTVLLNAARTQITINLSFQGLLAPITIAHIHNGPVGVSGPVIIDIRDFITTAPDLRSGSIMNAVINVTPEQANILLAGNGYFNIHTTQFPAGEIRGQINVVPEPSTYLLMATGLGGLVVFARRRRVTPQPVSIER